MGAFPDAEMPLSGRPLVSYLWRAETSFKPCKLDSTCYDTHECTFGAVDRSGGALSPFGGISRHRDTERQCRAVDRSYRILGIQQPVLSVETLTSTCWDTLKDISRAVNRSEGLISPFGGISTHRNHVEWSTTRIVSQACSNQF